MKSQETIQAYLRDIQEAREKKILIYILNLYITFAFLHCIFVTFEAILFSCLRSCVHLKNMLFFLYGIMCKHYTKHVFK